MSTVFEEKLKSIHKELQFMYGDLSDKYPEQLMAVTYIDPSTTKGILELGGNIGRNSCVMGKLLEPYSNRLVVLEPCEEFVQYMQLNKTLNNLNFNIETAALSKKSLMHKGWDTVQITTDIPYGWTPVTTITWDALKQKYNTIHFDTLVVDCEGALYPILNEEPEFLKDFKLIIIENDFKNINEKKFVDKEFIRYGFKVIYQQSGGWQHPPCEDCFYQVWKKD